ncbi:MAG: HNH endonuclease [Planctomycetes bacterium]|nr:HNH endonuclease [Planctomycetota bacterium]
MKKIHHNTNGETALSASVLVLNKLFMAIKVVNVKRAFGLLYKNYAEVIAKDNGRFDSYDFIRWVDYSSNGGAREHDEFIHTPGLRIRVPRVIRLTFYDKVPKKKVKFNRKNILARDSYTCQYCGKKYSSSTLSVDHVVPRSRGGSTSWTNIVACCHRCNTKKGGRLPREARMRLLKEPIAPKSNPTVSAKIKEEKYNLWKEFCSSGDHLAE